MSSKLLSNLPGFLLTTITGLLSADQQLVVQAITDGTYFHYAETPTGLINDSNTTFTLSTTPSPLSSLEVRLNGQLLTLTEDYSLVGTILTLNSAPMSGSIIRVTFVVSPI
jgi:hypothetical protein